MTTELAEPVAIDADSRHAIVSRHLLADGVLVRIAGNLSGTTVAHELRAALLAPLTSACRDVLVDAAGVGAVDDEALAVLLAAQSFVELAGRRFALSVCSPELRQALDAAGLTGELAMLGAPGTRRR